MGEFQTELFVVTVFIVLIVKNCFHTVVANETSAAFVYGGRLG